MLNRIANELYVSPRGFLGSSVGAQVPINPSNVVRLVHRLNYRASNPFLAPNQLTPNTEIEKLYNHYLKGTSDNRSFEFQKEVFVAAINAFGTSCFINWVKAQTDSPLITDNHLRQIADTMQFIMTGRRKMMIESWAGLVMPDFQATPESVYKNADAFKETFDEFIQFVESDGKSGALAIGQSFDKSYFGIDKIIWLWMQQCNGFGDFLGCLHLWFGNITTN